MTPFEDIRLLREYAEKGSESAFQELVDRHVNLVYSAALRIVVDPHLAEEVTQTAFIILARKAASLDGETILAGWLYRTTQFAGRRALRTEARRREREREAMQTNMEPDNAVWEHLAPILDQAMAELGDLDRNAILLSFFQNKTSREVGEDLGLKEAAAQKRVARAVEKLRKLCAGRGVVLPAATLMVLMSANAVHAAPAGAVSAATAAGGLGAASANTALVKGTLKLIAWAKYKMFATTAAALLAVGAVSYVAIEEPWFQPKYQNRTLNSWLAQMDDGSREFTTKLHWMPWDREVRLGAAQAEAASAIRTMGAEALPYLIENLKKADSSQFHYFKKAQPADMAARRQALLALDALGPQCKPLIPQLTEMLYNNHNPKEAAAILGAIGPEGWKVLTDSITSTNDFASSCSVWSLGSRKAALPGTIQALESIYSDSPFNGLAALDGWALVEIGADREQVVSLLIKGLGFQRAELRWGACVALGHAGADAKRAVPYLVALLKDKNAVVRHDAAQALEQIDPAVAAREGVTGALASEHIPEASF